MSLTIRKVAAELAPGRYGDGAGLYLQVTLTGTKSWLFRYETNQRERWMGLGSLNTFNLAEARERARKARQLIADGIDPLEARAAEKARLAAEAAKLMTFANAADQYYAAHEASWSNAKHRQQFRNTMAQYVLPKIGRLSVAAVDTGEVLKCIEPLWKDKTPTCTYSQHPTRKFARYYGRLKNNSGALQKSHTSGRRARQDFCRQRRHFSATVLECAMDHAKHWPASGRLSWAER